MTTIFDVADYILDKMEEVTTMQLEKLCFYSQAWYLAWEEIPLFEEDFQAWANGPVCPQLFQKHKGKFLLKKGEFNSGGSKNNLLGLEKEDVDIVINYYKDYTPAELSAATHSEAPWRDARGNLPAGAICTNVITKDSMRDYYSGLIS